MPVRRQKKLQEQEGFGRSCGGFSTKIHGLCDALGNPINFIVTAGQCHDAPWAIPLVSGISAENLLADKGYDSDDIRLLLQKKGVTPHIPPRSNRTEERFYDKHLYKERHKIEFLFGFLKNITVAYLPASTNLSAISRHSCTLLQLFNG